MVLSPGNRMTRAASAGCRLTTILTPRYAKPGAHKLAAEAKGEQTAIHVGPIRPAPLTVDYGLLPAAQNGRCCG